MKKTLLTTILCTLLGACSQTPTSERTVSLDSKVLQILDDSVPSQQQLRALSDAYIEETLPLDPLSALFFGDYRFNHLWPNSITDAHIADVRQLNRKYLTALESIDRASLTGQDRYTYDIFRETLQTNIKRLDFPSQYLPVNQFIFSPHNLFIQLGAGLSAQPLNTVKDFEDFLLRMDGFVEWMDQAIANMRLGMEKGIVLSEPVVESMLPQMRTQVLDDPSASPLLEPLIARKNSFSPEDYARLESAYLERIANSLSPVFARMSEFLEHEYLPNARVSHGLGALPGGEDWYEFLIKTNTTLPLSADEIHQIGLKEVDRIHEEMNRVMKDVEFDGDLPAFFDYLETDQRFYYDSPEDVVEAYKEVKDAIQPQLHMLFSSVPMADYVIRAYPSSQAGSAPGASYIPGAPDGSRPPVLFVNTDNAKAQPKFGVESLSVYEASPGRHLQISIQNGIRDLPRIRKHSFYTVYSEGWALYAESLGRELGVFNDPFQYFGKLNAELLQVMRLVVDTGIHHKGWTREQAIQYMLDHSALLLPEVTAEVERYMILPGQALSYKTGQLTIQSLREYAEDELGKEFDIRVFHDLILSDGPLPMPLLERKVEQWVSSVQAHNS